MRLSMKSKAKAPLPLQGLPLALPPSNHPTNETRLWQKQGLPLSPCSSIPLVFGLTWGTSSNHFHIGKKTQGYFMFQAQGGTPLLILVRCAHVLCANDLHVPCKAVALFDVAIQ